jgi:transcriptional regulator with PAS, ATPase and Fis domain
VADSLLDYRSLAPGKMKHDDYPVRCHRTEPTIIGSSPALQRTMELAVHAAAKSAKVVITGESGVGKDVLARFVHARSERATKPFVALNCAGMAETLLESELFGHVKGSFTGAYRDKPGCFEQAHEGTVFLDEIGDMGPRMQGVLLRFLETGEIRRVGSDGPPIHVDVRIISATNRDLYDLVKRGEFREDLYYRIHVVHLDMPPLRERVEDIEPLIQHMATKCGASLTFTEQAERLLLSYKWPGNVRQLQNVVEQLGSMVRDRAVRPEDLPPLILRQPMAGAEVVRERRRTIVNDLYDGLTSGELRFWEDVHRLFISRDVTRADLRQLIRRGLVAASGSYRGLLTLFGMAQEDYKALLNFLAAHECNVDSRRLRSSARVESAGSVDGHRVSAQ